MTYLATSLLISLASLNFPDPPALLSLEQQLLQEDPTMIARDAHTSGDAAKGAILFHQPALACTQCHTSGPGGSPLGPDLTKLGKAFPDKAIVESILTPSKAIERGYETVAIALKNGKTVTGLLAAEKVDSVVLRDPSQPGKLVHVARTDIEERSVSALSLMPVGLVNQLTSRQQFLDLFLYVREIADQGPARALALRPDPALLAPAVPEYERDIDHAGLIGGLDRQCVERGKAIFERVCANCHGTKAAPGSLPTSLRFWSGAFKNGADPHSMYRTLTYGAGQMAPQTWMVPRQKYDVIHYIREEILKRDNPTQYVQVDTPYLARLPRGKAVGPEPSTIEPWVAMDYGPSLMATIEVGDKGDNFAYKGIAVRLDDGPGGVSRGHSWAVYEHDTLRLAGMWSGDGFIDWNGINFNGRHEVHPRTVGKITVANPDGPGWSDPRNGRFTDPRLRGRDDKPYGPLPPAQAHYRGLYAYGMKSVLSYTVGETQILESPSSETAASGQVFVRTLNIGPRPARLTLQVAHEAGTKNVLRSFRKDERTGAEVVTFSPEKLSGSDVLPLAFDGRTALVVARPESFDLDQGDYTISARIKTREGGTIFSRAAASGPWVPGGKALFVRGGRLVFDVGWVGEVTSKRGVDDDRWHDVAMTYEHNTHHVRLYVDGEQDAELTLKPGEKLESPVVRLGFASPNFPGPRSYFLGDIQRVAFHPKALDVGQVAAIATKTDDSPGLVARWELTGLMGESARDLSGHGHDARRSEHGSSEEPTTLLAAVTPAVPRLAWTATGQGDLRLEIPAGTEPLRFALRLCRVDKDVDTASIAGTMLDGKGELDLAPLTRGGPPRWPGTFTTNPRLGADSGPFASDDLTLPENNPWFCQFRTTGFDFFPDGRRAMVCTWDGDLWQVDGVDQPEKGLTWKRVASGLFQPLGLKIVDGRVFVTCRDQIVILNDLNGDGEADFYENFNSDHQVTEHFHEFAMDLQTDAEGRFYYAKAARHGKKAIVPQHGTLLRVSKDGSRTDILATGFRAPNGVCVNPDGTFFNSDQEGFWLPKNRINWVRPGGFYGNMWGYHDVTDTSDSLMEPPVCWITNAFDRSPAELLWVEGKAWNKLKGCLLILSYGNGKVFVVPHEVVDGKMQGGMSALPVPPFPTGVMRGRFHPTNGQLYLCGMFAWAGDRTRPGGFYRLRATGKPVHVPVGLHASRTGLEITFSAPVDRITATDTTRYSVKTWALKRTQNYGSNHIDERSSPVTGATLSRDGRTVTLTMPEIRPTWCMEVRYSLKGAGGEVVDGTIDNSIHALRD